MEKKRPKGLHQKHHDSRVLLVVVPNLEVHLRVVVNQNVVVLPGDAVHQNVVVHHAKDLPLIAAEAVLTVDLIDLAAVNPQDVELHRLNADTTRAHHGAKAQHDVVGLDRLHIVEVVDRDIGVFPGIVVVIIGEIRVIEDGDRGVILPGEGHHREEVHLRGDDRLIVDTAVNLDLIHVIEGPNARPQ